MAYISREDNTIIEFITFLKILKQRFGDNIPKNYIDRVQVQRWLVAYYIRINQNKEIKPSIELPSVIPEVFSITALCDTLIRTKNIEGIYLLAKNVCLPSTIIKQFNDIINGNNITNPLMRNIYNKHIPTAQTRMSLAQTRMSVRS